MKDKLQSNKELWKPGQSGNPNGRPNGSTNLRSKENQLRWRSKGYVDPLDFFGQIISDENQSEETRLAAGSLAIPYLHNKLGTVPAPPDPTFMEIKLKNPNPTCIDHCVENITLLTVAKSSGEVSIEHADSLIADQKVILYAMLDQQKQIAAQGGPPEQTIRIEGGLPLLPGTNITMPVNVGAREPPGGDFNAGSGDYMNGHGPDEVGSHTAPHPSNEEQ